MAEPTSSAASAVATFLTIAVTSLLPGVNGDALIGSFAGAVVFALNAKDLSIIQRVVYMMVSILIGYRGADEVIQHTWLTSDALAAFGLSAVIVTLALVSIDRIRKFDITKIWNRG